MPAETTVEEIEQAYIEAWRLGLKAIAIYRDGCKRTQPLRRESTAGCEVDSTQVDHRAATCVVANCPTHASR